MLHTVSEELTTCGDSDVESNEIDITDSFTEINKLLAITITKETS